jgi:hypothetical protein
MSSAVRLLICVATVAGLLAGVLSLQPVSLAGLGADIRALPESLQKIAQAHQHQEELDDQQRVVSRQVTAKADVINELIDGQISLSEAVARFRALNEEDDSVAETVAMNYPAASRDASVCLQVLSWAEGQVSPERQTAVMARLNEEARGFLSPR